MSTSTRIKRVIPVALYTVFYCFVSLIWRTGMYGITLLIPVWTIRFHSANILLFHICYGFFISL